MISRIFKTVTKSVYDSQKIYRKRRFILEPVIHLGRYVWIYHGFSQGEKNLAKMVVFPDILSKESSFSHSGRRCIGDSNIYSRNIRRACMGIVHVGTATWKSFTLCVKRR